MKLLEAIEWKKHKFNELVMFAERKPFRERTVEEHVCGAVALVGATFVRLARFTLKALGFVVRFAFGILLFSFRLFIGALLR